jgi:hypothetical protein
MIIGSFLQDIFSEHPLSLTRVAGQIGKTGIGFRDDLNVPSLSIEQIAVPGIIFKVLADFGPERVSLDIAGALQ